MSSWGCLWIAIGFALGMFFIGEGMIQSMQIYFRIKRGIPWHD